MSYDDDSSILKHAQKETTSSLKLRGACKACRMLSVKQMDVEAKTKGTGFGVVIVANIPQTRIAYLRRVGEE